MNPYQKQPRTASWSKSVSSVSPFDLSGLYEKKFTIAPNDRIVTAGSCFAQHLARHLAASGYNFCNYEPAPKYFPENFYNSFNYGVYSARYCNIYTVRQLLQTFERAFDMRDVVEAYWDHKGGVVDPFRPVVEPGPFSDIDSLNAARATHYRAVKRVFTESDVLVFTLGLTEGWVDRRDGSVYPLCPGTAAGEWSPERYEFRNFTHAEIMDDFQKFTVLIRSVNPKIRILLTVSPVALKMTASDNHVLVANTHSKATLRSVAAEVSANDPFIDYFPSFEIISAHPMKAMFFEPDMREVNPAGVRFVMSHFSSQHPAAGKKGNADPHKDEEAIDIVCEEMLLEQAAK